MDPKRLTTKKRRTSAPKRGQVEYTTGQVAYLFSVSAHTVAKWCNKGILPSHRLPKTEAQEGERRITRAAVLEFARKNSIPLHRDPDRLPLVVWVGASPLAQVDETCQEQVDDVYLLGQLVRKTPPEAVVIEVAVIGRTLSKVVCQNLAKESPLPVVVVLLTEDDLDKQAWLDLGAATVVQADERHKLALILSLALNQDKVDPCRLSPTSLKSGSESSHGGRLAPTGSSLKLQTA